MNIPKISVLSPTLLSTKVTTPMKQNTNINISVNQQKADNPIPPTVQYPPPENDYPVYERSVELDDETQKLNDSVEFLKLVVRAYQDNVIYFNKYVVLVEDDLTNMLQSILHATEINYLYDDDYVAKCCQKTGFAKISKIMIKRDEKVENLKYNYPEIYDVFDNYNISLKYVLVE